MPILVKRSITFAESLLNEDQIFWMRKKYLNLDLEIVYDSILRTNLWLAFAEYKRNGTFLEEIESLYVNNRAPLRVGGETEEFEVRNGLRQG